MSKPHVVPDGHEIRRRPANPGKRREQGGESASHAAPRIRDLAKHIRRGTPALRKTSKYTMGTLQTGRAKSLSTHLQ
eukprot:3203941-Pyramimonas_sp.AAC.1